MREIAPAQLRIALAGAAGALMGAKHELGRLDAMGGDGDLGATMDTGFEAVLARLEQEPGENIVGQLRAVGDTLCSRAPSTFGTLLGLAMTTAADSLPNPESLTVETLADFLTTMSETIASLGKVELGQRTVLDALGPSASAVQAAADRGDARIDVVLDAAWRAAEDGAEATASMTPIVGRARWAAESATGFVDAGAKAWAIWLKAFSDSLTQQASEE